MGWFDEEIRDLEKYEDKLNLVNKELISRFFYYIKNKEEKELHHA